MCYWITKERKVSVNGFQNSNIMIILQMIAHAFIQQIRKEDLYEEDSEMKGMKETIKVENQKNN